MTCLIFICVGWVLHTFVSIYFILSIFFCPFSHFYLPFINLSTKFCILINKGASVHIILTFLLLFVVPVLFKSSEYCLIVHLVSIGFKFNISLYLYFFSEYPMDLSLLFYLFVCFKLWLLS